MLKAKVKDEVKNIIKYLKPEELKELSALMEYIPSWIPRDDQLPLWEYLQSGGLRAVEAAHRRWGKDDVALHYAACASQERIGNYWHMLPQYNQCRKAIWEAVNPKTGMRRIDEAFPVEMRKSFRESDMSIKFKNGSTWQLVGSDNYNALVGSPPIGIVYSEYALANPESWAYLSPILEENGGWAIFISTSRGNNHFKRLVDHARVAPGWFGQILTADDTPVFSPEKLEAIKADMIATFGEEMGLALFLQEYYCSFEGAVLGAYFAKQMSLARKEGRIGDYPHDPALEVDTAWDLGVDDSMSIWFLQHKFNKHVVIDYYENTGYGLEHYWKVMEQKGYRYGNHYMPHDAEAREMTNSEIAQTRKKVAEDLGIKPIIVVSRARKMDIIIMVHIPAVRNILGSCYFDEKKCVAGISALEGYRAEYDEEKKVLTNRPLHDWTSHGASAFITFAVGYNGVTYKDDLQ
jgi:hypothetical protein